MACSRPNNTFKTLGGDVPVHYGSKGKQLSFPAPQAFENLLDATFAELWQRCPAGKADIILSAGT